MNTFSPAAITEWLDKRDGIGRTAFSPNWKAISKSALKIAEIGEDHMPKDNFHELRASLKRLHEAFSAYSAEGDFCTFCWNSEETAVVMQVPVDAIPTDFARKLMHEASDHFTSSSDYRRCFPG